MLKNNSTIEAVPTTDISSMIRKDILKTEDPYAILNNSYKASWNMTIDSCVPYGVDKFIVIITVTLAGTIRGSIGISSCPEYAIEKALLAIIHGISKQIEIKPTKDLISSPTESLIINCENPVIATSDIAEVLNHNTEELKEKICTEDCTEICTEEKLGKINTWMKKLNITWNQGNALVNIFEKYKIKSLFSFLKYLQAWSIDIKVIEDLNTNNIDEFIAWSNNDNSFKID